MKLLEFLENYDYLVTTHSVYKSHLDKLICFSAMKNIVCHSNTAKQCLNNHENKNVFMIPHGCKNNNKEELFNAFMNPYTIFQFGFGFDYKGVDKAIKAISYLKNKYKNIFYCYVCSISEHSQATHNNYIQHLKELIEKNNVEDNILIIKKYLPEEIIYSYLRTMKLAIFPYTTDENNIVYGASGAIRMAMECDVPIIASNSNMFDDLDGVIPRPETYIDLAIEIDKIFSNENYKKDLIKKNKFYINKNSWEEISKKYLEVMHEIKNGN
jgi:glycosyltransferase involved in cell wall biosynthesis